ncbi:MAG: 3-deoxy-manno-octulosonate cytidylyltransferase [Nitrospina sp.]|jgi:3-deoxy-manno-octulosonate cytidylyltransferase (CMP-KDO synthetase)|nr:3-deoxy-manno-octulosonate cytidylyltransferase [Nitrospina sp.]MBT6718341.1 3-deoxy-manno-octulosonate cytidylyltransferase [Nitrospina sp.]
MPTEPRVLVVIPARWASSRFPGKPLAKIAGVPMIQRVVEQANKAQSVAEVIVATDDSRIFDLVNNKGGTAIMTSESHESGTDRVAEVARDRECDIVVNVQGDEPLIPPQNIDLVVKPLIEDPSILVTSLRILIRDADELLNRNITKVVVDKFDSALYFSKAPIPWDRDKWSEGADISLTSPLWFKHIGLYAYRKTFLMEYSTLPISKLEKVEKLEQLRILENGYSVKVFETKYDSIGVDSESDIKLIEKQLASSLEN